MAYTIVDNIILASDPRLKISGGPTFSTTVTTTRSGWRSAQSNWSEPLWVYTIKYIETRDNFQEIINFWLGRCGPAYAFLIEDPVDKSAGEDGHVKKIGDKYFLTKKYDDSVRPFYRRITRPVVAGVTLSDVAGESLTVSATTGEVEGATSEGTWTGDFRVPVAFTADRMDYDFRPSTKSGYFEWDVEVKEVRVSSG